MTMATFRNLVNTQYLKVRDNGNNQLKRSLVYLPQRRREIEIQFEDGTAESKRPPRLLLKNFLSIRHLEQHSPKPISRHMYQRIMSVPQPIFHPHRTLLDDRNRWTEEVPPQHLAKTIESEQYRNDDDKMHPLDLEPTAEPDLGVNDGLGMAFWA